MTGAPPRSVAASLRIAAIRPELGSEDEAGNESSVSTRMVSSAITSRRSARKSAGRSPGSRRQSSPARDELQPARGLLRHGDLHDLSASLSDVDVIALGQQVLGARQQLGAVLHDPASASLAARLLVGGGEQYHVPVDGLAAPLERDQ